MAVRSASPSLACGFVDREHVHAVDLDAGDAVARRMPRDVRRGRLQRQRHRLRVAVRVADEHDGQLVDRREVEPLVELAAARAAVTEGRPRDLVDPEVLRRERSADAVREVVGLRARSREHAVRP